MRRSLYLELSATLGHNVKCIILTENVLLIIKKYYEIKIVLLFLVMLKIKIVQNLKYADIEMVQTWYRFWISGYHVESFATNAITETAMREVNSIQSCTIHNISLAFAQKNSFNQNDN